MVQQHVTIIFSGNIS